jgi:hypothetical protein
MKEKKNDDQILIRSILGKDKYLMLNTKFIKLFGLQESIILTYIMDKLEYVSSWENDAIGKGITIFRKEIEEKFGLSDYQQRKIESSLISQELLQITPTFDGKNTYNNYKIDFVKLVSVLDLYPDEK